MNILESFARIIFYLNMLDPLVEKNVLTYLCGLCSVAFMVLGARVSSGTN